MSGTYVISLTLFGINGNTISTGSGNNTTQNLHDPNFWLDGSGDSATLSYIPAGNCFSLDGGVSIPFAALPSGFTPSSASLRQKGTVSTSPGGVKKGASENISQIITTYGAFFGPVTTKAISAGPTFPVPTSLSPIPSAIQLYSLLQFSLSQVRNHLPSDASLLEFVVNNIEVYGTYDIIASQSSIQNPLVPVYVGDKVIINSPTGGLNSVTQIQLNYLDPINGSTLIILNETDGQNPNLPCISKPIRIFFQDPLSVPGLIQDALNKDALTAFRTGVKFCRKFIFIQTPFTLWFYLPPGPPKFNGPVVVTITGTQFSGSVNAGTLQILYADVSGIYTLVNNQTSDILYFRSGYTTDNKLILLSFTEEIDDDDYFSMLLYQYKLLSQNDLDEEYEQEDNFMMTIAIPRIIILPLSVEIPSPYIRTGF